RSNCLAYCLSICEIYFSKTNSDGCSFYPRGCFMYRNRNFVFERPSTSTYFPGDRVFRLHIPLLAVFLAAAAAHAQSSDSDWDRVQTLVSPIRGVITTPPKNLITPKFTSGALMGNGDIGVVAGSTEITEQRYSFGKSDFWGTHWNS